MLENRQKWRWVSFVIAPLLLLLRLSLVSLCLFVGSFFFADMSGRPFKDWWGVAMVAQASLYPSLSLSTGYGTSWSGARQRSVVNTDGTLKYEAYPFLRQYADNASAYVSVGLKIPILTGLSGRIAVNRARLAVKEADYSSLATEKQLRNKIIQAQIDSDAAKDRYLRAREEAHYAVEAQRQIGEKYNLGTTDFLTWSTAVVEVTKAMYSLAEAKYSSLSKSEILRNYYMYR